MFPGYGRIFVWFLKTVFRVLRAEPNSCIFLFIMFAKSMKYSMDTTANIKLLAENGLQAEGAWKENVRSQREALLRLWSWIERVESLCSEKSEDLYAADGGTLNWAAKGLIDAGAWRLLRADDGVAKDEEIFSETLCCTTYDSPGRR